MLVRQVVVKFVLVILDRFQAGVFGIGVLGEAARVEKPGIPLAFAVHHDLRQQLAMTAGFADTGAQADRAIGVVDAGNRADQRRAVDGVGDGAIDHRVNPRLGQRRQALENALHVVETTIEVGRAQRLGEVGVDAIHAEGLTALFVDAYQQAFLFLAAVKIVAWITDDGHAKIKCFEFGHGVGEEVHVLHRGHRVGDAEHVAHLVDPVAGRVDHLFAGDVAVFAVHDKFAVGLARDAFDRIEAVHLGARRTRLARQRKGNAGRIDVAVERIPPGAEQAVGVHQWMTPAGFSGIDKFHVDAHAAGHADVVLVGIDLRLGVREAHAPGDVVGNRVVGIGREFTIQVDAVALESDQGLVGAKLGDLRRRVPGRARGEFIALDEHDVGPAFAGQVIECRATGDTAADNDHARVGFDRFFSHVWVNSVVRSIMPIPLHLAIEI